MTALKNSMGHVRLLITQVLSELSRLIAFASLPEHLYYSLCHVPLKQGRSFGDANNLSVKPK